MDTNYRTARRFVLGLDRKICNTVEAIAPTTYVAALRATRAMEGTDRPSESCPSTEGQERCRDEDDRCDSSPSLPPIRPNRQLRNFRGASKEGKADQTTSSSVTSVGRIIGVSVRLALEPAFNVGRRVT